MSVRFMITIVLISAVSFVPASGGGWDLPPYIPKCFLSDPKLNDCIKVTANTVIPRLAKGDVSFGIPSTSPVVFAEAPMIGENIVFILSDTYNDDIKTLRITDVDFDWKNGKVFIEAVIDRAVVTAKNYTIVSGQIVDIPVSGYGSFNMTLVGTKIEYKADLHIYKKKGEKYLEFVNSNINSDVERGYYHFENIKSPVKDDVNAYINDHWREFRAQLKPVIKTYLITFMHYPLNVIFNRVPLHKIFLP